MRLDGTLKPTYDVLLALVRGEWWTPAQTLVTAADGRVTVEGVAGSYRVSAGDASAELALHAATAVVEETAQLRA